MNRLVQTVSLTLITIGIAGCTVYRLEELREAELIGSPFTKALAEAYRGFAVEEEAHYDWASVARFSQKGLAAAYGHEVTPEELDGWDIAREIRPDLEIARAALMEALTDDVKEVRPQLAADAQFYFDCWVEQQEEGWQVEDIARCRSGFEQAMQALTFTGELPKEETEASPPPVPKPEAAAAPAPEAKSAPAARAKEAAAYIVFFAVGDASLTPIGSDIVDGVAGTLASNRSYRIVINGRTDAESPEELFTRRAQAIESRLLSHGVERSAIDIVTASGAHSTATPGDGKKPVDRKVEIFVAE